MAQFLILSVAALAVVLPQVLSVPAFGNFGPILPGYPGANYAPRPLTLTCAINFTDYYKKNAGVVNAIAVTIKEKSSAYGGMKPSLLSYVGYGSLTGSGLTATIDIFSVIGGPVSVAFTERAKPEQGCFPDDFGSFLTPKSDLGGVGSYPGYGSIGGIGNYGIGSYGGYANYGGYGTGGSYGTGGGYGTGLGIGLGAGFGAAGGMYGGGFGSGFGGGYGVAGSGYGDDIPGVIAKVKLSPGTSSSINIDNLAGFSQLKELAGRGVVVCPSKAIQTGYHGAQCEGGMLSCCALHYDQGDQSLNGKYDSY